MLEASGNTGADVVPDGKARRAVGEMPARPAGKLGNCNDKLLSDQLKVSWQKRVILGGFFSTSVSAPSKNSGFSMSKYHASKELKVRLIGGQQNIDAGSVRCCGTRCPHIKPVQNLADQSASIKTSSTESTSNLKQFPVSSFDFKSIEGILKDKSCVKILGASRWCLVHLN